MSSKKTLNEYDVKYLRLYLAAAEKPIYLELPYKEAVKHRQTMHSLRALMDQEKHPVYTVIASVVISIQPAKANPNDIVTMELSSRNYTAFLEQLEQQGVVTGEEGVESVESLSEKVLTQHMMTPAGESPAVQISKDREVLEKARAQLKAKREATETEQQDDATDYKSIFHTDEEGE